VELVEYFDEGGVAGWGGGFVISCLGAVEEGELFEGDLYGVGCEGELLGWAFRNWMGSMRLTGN
jgi:hypothetical protein